MKKFEGNEFELLTTIEDAGIQLDLARAVLTQVLEDYFSDTEGDKFLRLSYNNISNLLNAADVLLFGCKKMLEEKIQTWEAA